MKTTFSAVRGAVSSRLSAVSLSAMMLSVIAAPIANADSNIKDRLYVGAAINQNIIDSPFSSDDLDAAGYSVFAGLTFANSVDGLMTAVELGYNDTGEFFNGPGESDINGMWVAGVAEKTLPEIDPRLTALGRFGLDLGDDDGLLLGAGLGFHASERLGLRAEFINKDASGVYQLGALIHF
jgi:hypothetical protein